MMKELSDRLAVAPIIVNGQEIVVFIIIVSRDQERVVI